MKDYYDILGIARDATPNVVKIAYEGKVKKLARLSDSKRAAEEKPLKEAFAILSNPAKREHFDSRLMELDANLGGSGSNAPLVIGIVVVALTAAGIGYFLSERSKAQKAARIEEQRVAAERKAAPQKETLERADGKAKR